MIVSRPGPSLAVQSPADPAARGFVAPHQAEKGAVLAFLVTHIVTAAGATPRTPHTVRVSKAGYKDASQQATAGEARGVAIVLKR
mgnify:CR=1 FL=1